MRAVHFTCRYQYITIELLTLANVCCFVKRLERRFDRVSWMLCEHQRGFKTRFARTTILKLVIVASFVCITLHIVYFIYFFINTSKMRILHLTSALSHTLWTFLHFMKIRVSSLLKFCPFSDPSNRI